MTAFCTGFLDKMINYLVTLRRCLSHKCSKAHSSTTSLVYTAPLISAVRNLKLVSITTASGSVVVGPLIVLSDNISSPLVARLALCSMICLVGTSTTATLHYFLRGYITRLYYNKTDGLVTANVLSIFGRKKERSFYLTQVETPANRLGFNTFQVNGTHYYLHPNVIEDNTLDEQLMKNVD